MALLRCSVMSSMGGSPLVFPTITDGRSTNYAAPPADTRRVGLPPPFGVGETLCVHVLSSFQRTGRAPLPSSTVVRGTFQSYYPPRSLSTPCLPAIASWRGSPSRTAGMNEPGSAFAWKARRTAPSPLTIRSRPRAVNLSGGRGIPRRRAHLRPVYAECRQLNAVVIGRARSAVPRPGSKNHDLGPNRRVLERRCAPPRAAASRAGRSALRRTASETPALRCLRAR